MAGTLTISTLSDGTNSTSATNCISGSAKAWVNFNGTGTIAIRGSYNVSSLTDYGTGNYGVNFTNAIADTNYAALVSGYAPNNDNNSTVNLYGSTGTMTTTAVRVQCGIASNGAGADSPIMCVVVFR